MGLLSMAMAKAKAKATGTTTHTTDMGLLLVFFPQNHNAPNTNSTFKRTNSNNLILSKTQSTISICALLFFLTLLLFTLSTFEPTNTLHHNNNQPTKLAQSKTQNHNNWFLPKRFWPNTPFKSQHSHYSPSKALQRMGTLYRRGTRAMTDLVICHVADETTVHEFRYFLRLIHRSGLTARTDVVFLFASGSLSSSFAPVIREENEAFSSLVELHSELNSTRWSQLPESTFDVTRFFVRVGKKGEEIAEPLWGKKTRINTSDGESSRRGGGGEVMLSYGSVLSFDAAELDPENSLAGFLDRVPLSLRRWACYPMLLGRVRHNFKHVMLVDVKNAAVVNDPLGRVRNRKSESVFLFVKHGKKNNDATRTSQRPVNPAVVMGGARGVRRLANAVVVEIVRAAMQQRKRKNSVSESAILSQLTGGNEFMLKAKGVELMEPSESIPDASQLSGRNSSASLSDYAIIQRGTTSNHDLISSVIKKQICSSVVDSSVYRDC
ncbi:hypothetical protein HN51_015188 [Arachis hypogaea]|uniref:DUF7780 domain-containing protein n=2 Tax=Arachis TaxID=3817 RepID=A0A445CLM0_ARAHY|nr:uncharacterized protein LOC107492624 [Arachis duranensis]XP_025604384.1 uncharacterized protein LOC112696021 [Arachis hypogaea]QHO44783.1 uncharacterized protein DS421_6g173700 [Arachis hypogaea]RYR51809.1 hypothetical protein Ahy_A06g026784 isoform C [Arachis hypogaea]